MGKGLRAESTVSAPFTTIYYGEVIARDAAPPNCVLYQIQLPWLFSALLFLSPQFFLSDHLMRYNYWIAMFRFAATIGRH